ncbi:MAG: hypothetical protein FJ112_07980, partial [Deltaproteobacteria bacterium]|nr:hypothetical protein [Deltaproteobacteria bacterium]
MSLRCTLPWGASRLVICTLAISALFSVVGCKGGNRRSVTDRITNRLLTVTPSQVTLSLGQQQIFIVAGGMQPYTSALDSDHGSLQPLENGGGFMFVADSTISGEVRLRFQDSRGQVVRTKITVLQPLQISPKNFNLSPGDNLTFTATTPGLTGPLSYSIIGNSNNATIVPNTGLFTAPRDPTPPVVVQVKVTDSLNRTDIAEVNIASPITLNFSTVTLRGGGTQTITVNGGFPPYSLSGLNEIGTLSSNRIDKSGESVTFTATNPTLKPASATLTVQDVANRTKTAILNVKPPVVINPPTVSIVQGNAHTFMASGGEGPYTYSLLGTFDSVTLDSTTGVLSSTTPISASLNFTVRVTDRLGQTSDSAVTVDPVLKLLPASVNLGQLQNQSFSASGGNGSYTFSLTPSSVGSLSGDSTTQKIFTAPLAISQNSSVDLTVTDGRQRTARATINLVTPVSLARPPKNLFQGATHTFSATGGSTSYSYQIVGNANGCSINSTTGVFTAPPSVANNFSVTVSATDAINQTGSTTFDVKTPLVISPDKFSM